MDPQTGFPSSYTDTNGLTLQLCQDGPPLCLAGPQSIEVVNADPEADAEAFWWAADAAVGPFDVHLALEAAYMDGQEIAFQRTQVNARTANVQGLRANTTYTVTDPYGSYTCQTRADGTIPTNGCRIETSGDFNTAVTGRLGPFLTWDTYGAATGAPPAGYVGDNATPHKATGSPTGYNAVRVEGPGLTGTCQIGLAAPISNCFESDLWTIQGKLAPGVSASAAPNPLDFGNLASTAPVTKSITYRNTSTGTDTTPAGPVTVSSVVTGGTNADRFTVRDNCSTVAGGVAPGASCTIDVTFTPQDGLRSAATLTITDDTPVATRVIDLQGANTGAGTVSPRTLSFPDTATGSVSAEDRVVVGNTGPGPLTVTAALTGFSAAHYRLGTNGCTAPVPAGQGCEIGVRFAPTSPGIKEAVLRITDSTGTEHDVSLTGRGVDAPADTTLPTAPTLSGSLTGNTANLSWTAATDNVGVTGYQVLRNNQVIGTTTTTRTYSDANLAAASYSYTVKAVDAAGNVSPASNAVTVRVGATDTTAPTISGRAPAMNATGVSTTANTTVLFSETVTNVTTDTFTLKDPGGATVPATVTFNTSTGRHVLNPVSSLISGTRYTAAVSTAVTDNAGNAVVGTTTQPLTWSFTTSGTAPAPTEPPPSGDTTAPTVTFRSPAPNTQGVALGSNILVGFSEVVQGVVASGSTTSTTLTLTTPTGQTVPAAVTFNSTSGRWVINPASNLLPDTRYRVNVIGGQQQIRDMSGNPVASSSWEIVTGPRPTVTTSTPRGTGVSRTAPIQATFSEGVNNVNGTTVKLRLGGATGTVVPATVGYNAATRVMTITPSSTLLAGRQYTVTLLGGALTGPGTNIADQAGNSLANFNWSFTTAS